MNRRDWLAGLGLVSAGIVARGFGCGGGQRPLDTVRGPDVADATHWLRDAYGRLASAFVDVQVLAVTRTTTIGARDTLGPAISQTRRDGVVLAVKQRDGMRRELATSDLTAAGIDSAVRALVDSSPRTAPRTPRPATHKPARLERDHLFDALAGLWTIEPPVSRIVYAAVAIELDETTVWSVQAGGEREQQLVRVRQTALRAAWNGERPSVGEVTRGWQGRLDEPGLDREALELATRHALELMTPARLADTAGPVLLDPSVAAALVDAATPTLIGERPPVDTIASPALSIVDDASTRGAYGGFIFDDAGQPARAIALVDRGRLVRGAAPHVRRPGHLGGGEPQPSHLVIIRGSRDHGALVDDGLLLEGATSAVLDAASNRLVVGAARVRELRGGKPTGRVYPHVELVGDLSRVLGDLDVATTGRTFALRDEIDGEPRWRSIDAPWLSTRGLVRARELA